MGRRNAALMLTGILANGASLFASQILALVLLSPQEYGYYALGFVCLGFVISAAQSLVIDVGMSARGVEWAGYSSATVTLSLASGLSICAALLALDSAKGFVVAFGVGSTAAIYRQCARGYLVIRGEWAKILTSDTAALSVSIAAIVLISVGFMPATLDAVTWAWGVGAIVASMASFLAPVLSVRAGGRWIRGHRERIRDLYAESLVMDVAVLAAPLIVSRLLTTASFGTFRASMSVLFRVRLVLTASRPVLMDAAARLLRSRRAPWVILGASASAGIAMGYTARIAASFEALNGSVLGTLGPYASLVGVMAFGQVVGFVGNMVCRARLSGRQLLRFRVADSLQMVVLPVLGALVGGLMLAVQGLAVAMLISAGLWTAGMARARHSRYESQIARGPVG